MIPWIDSMGRTWGWQWRLLMERDGYGASIKSWLGKIGEPGGSDHEFERLLGDALAFHRAYVTLNLDDRLTIASHYIDTRPVKVKALEAEIAERTWWQRLHYAHRRLMTVLDPPACAQCAYAQSG